jgi:hypothetical protein
MARPPARLALSKLTMPRENLAGLWSFHHGEGDGKGDHQKWHCPCGTHMAVIVQDRSVSPGVVRDTIRKPACLPEGWLR